MFHKRLPLWRLQDERKGAHTSVREVLTTRRNADVGEGSCPLVASQKQRSFFKYADSFDMNVFLVALSDTTAQQTFYRRYITDMLHHEECPRSPPNTVGGANTWSTWKTRQRKQDDSDQKLKLHNVFHQKTAKQLERYNTFKRVDYTIYQNNPYMNMSLEYGPIRTYSVRKNTAKEETWRTDISHTQIIKKYILEF